MTSPPAPNPTASPAVEDTLSGRLLVWLGTISERVRLLVLVVVTSVCSLLVGALVIFSLYHNELSQARTHLSDMVGWQKSFLSATIGKDQGGNAIITLINIYQQYDWSEYTGEFVVGFRDGDYMQFPIVVGKDGVSFPFVLRFDSGMAMPMQKALDSETGTVVASDYQGARVLAAYTFVDVTGLGGVHRLGVVAKVDMEELQAPFLRAAWIIGGLSLLAAVIGAFLLRLLLGRLEERAAVNRRILDSTPEAIITTDAAGLITGYNQTARETFGYRPMQVIGRPLTLLVSHLPDDWREGHADPDDGDAPPRGGGDEPEGIRKDGSRFPLEYECREVRSGSKLSFTIVIRDVSARKREVYLQRVMQATLERKVAERTAALSAAKEALERDKAAQAQLIGKLAAAQSQLLQSEKMAAIGQLAAGVAHEINNPVGYINSNLESLEGYVADLFSVMDVYQQAEAVISADSKVMAAIEEVKANAELSYLRDDVRDLVSECKEGIVRVRRIVSDLKDFSHADSGEWEWADLHQGLDATLNIVHNEIKYKADVCKDYGDLPQVECLPGQINQVFMNLLVNAAHAIEDRGTITLSSGTSGDNVWVSVTDTGTGIGPESMKKLFDPFYTTKPVGQGTGLGLSLSYGIIKKHHGHIEVKSEVGHGTTFTVTIPVARPKEALLQEAC